jgi:hypothetical protein
MRDDPIDLASPSYTPNRLLNHAAELLGARNDARLALILEVDCAYISRIRSRKEGIGPGLMVRIMDRTGWHIQHLRELAGMPFDGVTKLVDLAHRVGLPFPHTFTAQPQDQQAEVCDA